MVLMVVSYVDWALALYRTWLRPAMTGVTINVTPPQETMMSFNRENVVWQSQDGTWNLGFYRVLERFGYSDDEDYDPEWDVDYDYENFEWLSTGHPSLDAARAEWKGANPGMMVVASGEDRVAELDAMADRFKTRRARQ